MGFFSKIRTSVVRTARALTQRASTVLGSLRKSESPLADRLLADALRIGEIPSPTDREEQRAAFVRERLRTLGLSPQVDEDGNVRARDIIVAHAWPGGVYLSDRVVDCHVKRLRRKLREAGAGEDLIETVYGLGYRLRS